MHEFNSNLYFADYMDYCIEKRGRNTVLPFEQLTFDFLCFYPASIALTLTSTLIEDSSKRFIEFDDFWRSGKLKVHLLKGDTADKYLSRKLASSSNTSTDNYELNIYLSDQAAIFVNKYLKCELLDNGIDYVLPRISNADKNNRRSFMDNLAINERTIIESPYSPMKMNTFDRLALQLEKLADDTTFIFQRSYIIRDLVAHKIFKNTSLISKTLLSIFDTSYNQAMAQSIDATTISTMSKQLNGLGLRSLIKGYDLKLYNLIRSMSPKQIFLLAQDKNWQIFRGFIGELFTSLSRSILYAISQTSDFYKQTIKYETKYVLIDTCLDKIVETALEALKYANPMVYLDIQHAKYSVSNSIGCWKRMHSREDEYYSEEIVKRTKLVEQICEDICNSLYI